WNGHNLCFWLFFFQAEDGIRDGHVTGVQTCALPIYLKQIGKVPLLNARQEVELAKRIEAGLFADQKLAEDSRNLSAEARFDLEEIGRASCRERVKISGVAGYINKNTLR